MTKLLLNRTEIISLVKNIMEQSDEHLFDGFDDWDYYEALFVLFKKWAETNVPEDDKDYPISFLLEKYGSKFVRDWADNLFNADSEDFSINNWNVKQIVKNMVKRGLYKFPSKRKTEKFTEKYKRALEAFKEGLNLPPFVEIQLIEKTPYSVKFKIVLDYPEFLKDPSNKSFHSHHFERELENFITNFLGLDLGNPNYGQLEITRVNTEYTNLESWIKNVLNKEIKKQIKSLPNGHHIHSMKFEPTGMGGTLTLRFKSTMDWSKRRAFVQSAKELISNLGYPRIKIEY